MVVNLITPRPAVENKAELATPVINKCFNGQVIHRSSGLARFLCLGLEVDLLQDLHDVLQVPPP